MKNKFKTFLFFSALSLSFLGQSWLTHNLAKPQIIVSKQQSAFNFDAHFLKFFNLGNKRLISSLLWVKTIIESDIEHYKGDPLNSWMYLRFKTIFSIDPWFLRGYRFAAQYLSIIKDDLEGASEIYKQGLSEYPNDYPLNLNAGFHYIYELGKIEEGIHYFEKIMTYPQAPSILTSIVARLKSNLGDLETAFALILSKFQDMPDESPLKQIYQDRLYAIRAEIDLKCLNEQNNTRECNKLDFAKRPYIYETRWGKYRAQQEWTPFRLKTRDQR